MINGNQIQCDICGGIDFYQEKVPPQSRWTETENGAHICPHHDSKTRSVFISTIEKWLNGHRIYSPEHNRYFTEEAINFRLNNSICVICGGRITNGTCNCDGGG